MSIAYDPEKYREKREKVLGIRKRGVGFGMVAALVALVIVAGLSVVTVPQAMSYLSGRHLDDAIIKLESAAHWPERALESLRAVDGVKNLSRDKNGARLVVTYDRRKMNLSKIRSEFDRHGLTVTVLNQVNHLQHKAVMKKEEEESEAS